MLIRKTVALQNERRAFVTAGKPQRWQCHGAVMFRTVGRLFVMRPQSQHFDNMLILQDLVDQAMLDIDTSGIGAAKITDEFLVGWRILEGVDA